jgi:hypothetical protein
VHTVPGFCHSLGVFRCGAERRSVELWTACGERGVVIPG